MWLCSYLLLLLILQLQNDAQSHSGELDEKFQLAQDTLEMMLSSMYSIRDQLSNMVSVILDFLFIHSKIFFKVQMWLSKYALSSSFQDETSTRHLSQETNVCSLWYAWDTMVWFDFKICFYFIRVHYICCVMNESGQITLLEKDVKLWTLFVCVFLGSFNHPTMTQDFTS